MLFNDFFNEYPYRDISSTNLDWLIKQLRKLEKELINFVSLNTITYADPIQWSITTQYKMNTVVVEPISKTAYISTKPVPIGVRISDTNYWTPIFDLNQLSSNRNITLREDGFNVLASFPSHVDDWLIWQDLLYRVVVEIPTDTPYMVGYNIERYTVEMFVKDYVDDLTSLINALSAKVGNLNNLDTTEKNTIVGAINELVGAIADVYTTLANTETTINGKIGVLTDLTTTAKNNLVAAINEVVTKIDDEAIARQNGDSAINTKIGTLTNLNTPVKTSIVNSINSIYSELVKFEGSWITPQDFGAIGDGVTDDTQAVQLALDDGRPVRFVSNYAVTHVKWKWGNEHCKILDGSGYNLIGLSSNVHTLEFCQGGALVLNLTIVGLGIIGQVSSLYWHNDVGQAAGFNRFYNLKFDFCYHCIEYGDGNEGALSENHLIGFWDYSCNVLITSSGKGNQLFITDSEFNATHYQNWQNDDTIQAITNGSGSILSFENCTLENTNNENSAFNNSGEVYINNCVLEFAGINFATFKNTPSTGNDGFLSVTNSRCYIGGVGKHVFEIANGGHIYMNNVFFDNSPFVYEMFGVVNNCTIDLHNVHTNTFYLPTEALVDVTLNITNSTFQNGSISDGYWHIDDSNIEGLAGSIGILSNLVYGKIRSTCASGDSVFVSDGTGRSLQVGFSGTTTTRTFILEGATNRFCVIRNQSSATPIQSVGFAHLT